MGRYVRNYRIEEPGEVMFEKIKAYLFSEGYKYEFFQNEAVFKKGNGIITAPTFFKVTYEADILRVEAWIKYALFPGVYGADMDLEGFYGFALKDVVKKRAMHIEQFIIKSMPISYL